MSNKKKQTSSREARKMRTQQIIFSIIAIMIILVMVIGLFAKY
jgi:predicted nucleic acid-binding Zn ribbon protein